MSLLSRLVARALGLPPASTHDLVITRDLEVRAPDGVVLRTDHYRPRDTAKPPTILVRSPYGRRGVFGALLGPTFAERGFQVVVQSCRGTADSGGRLDPFGDERTDGLATLAWLREQPWYDGRLATIGPSYLGFVQWAIASEAAPDLAAMVPWITASEFRSQTYAGEAFSLDTALSWTYLMSNQARPLAAALLGQLRRSRILGRAFQHLPLGEADAQATGETQRFFQEWLVHTEPGDPYWTRRDHSAGVPNVRAPVHLIGGLYDIFLPWQLADYASLRRAGHVPYLTLGAWGHASRAMVPVAIQESLTWLRAHLLGDRRALREAPVRVFVTGLNAWREFADWPPPGASAQRWHLGPDRTLARAAPRPSDPDRYRYDPADPTPSVGGATLNDPLPVVDNRALESRADVLTYTSDPLADDLEAIGPVSADLHVRSSVEHTDFFVRLCDVHPDGTSLNVCDGLLRVRPGAPAREPDGSLHLVFELWPAAHRFRRGHRVRVQVSSGAHPRFVRNTGTGESLATDTRWVVAEQSVLHDPEHPSAIVLYALA